MLAPWKKSCDKPRQHIKKQIHYFAKQGLSGQSYGFSSSHVWMWELDHEESWTLKNRCFWTVVLEKTLESPLDTRRSNQSILKEISPEYSLEGLMLKLELQYFGHLMWRKDPDAGKDWRQEEKEMTEDEMVGWHHRLDGHEFGVTKSRTRLNNWTELNWALYSILAWKIPMECGAWWATIHGIAKSRTQLSNFNT